MDKVKAMTLFRRVAESGNFSTVARETGLSQPSVSKYVAALEQQLEIQLLNRSTRQLSLTEAGTEYYHQCVRILDELDELENSIGHSQSNPTGTLRINLPLTFGRMYVLPQIKTFMEKYPQLNVDLVMDDRYSDLVKDGIDLAIRIGPLADSTLIARKICESERVTVASPEYLSRRGEPVVINDLSEHNCLVYTFLTTGNEWHFTKNREKYSVRVNGNFCANSPDAMRFGAEAGIGIAVTPLWLVNDLIENNKLKILLPDYKPVPLAVNAVFQDRRFVPKKVRCFIEHVQNYMDISRPGEAG